VKARSCTLMAVCSWFTDTRVYCKISSGVLGSLLVFDVCTLSLNSELDVNLYDPRVKVEVSHQYVSHPSAIGHSRRRRWPPDRTAQMMQKGTVVLGGETEAFHIS
jgi:hypothetical protein